MSPFTTVSIFPSGIHAVAHTGNSFLLVAGYSITWMDHTCISTHLHLLMDLGCFHVVSVVGKGTAAGSVGVQYV